MSQYLYTNHTVLHKITISITNGEFVKGYFNHTTIENVIEPRKQILR